jgi:hypothetical protein
MNDARNVRRTPKTSYLTIRSWGTALDHEQSTFHTAESARATSWSSPSAVGAQIARFSAARAGEPTSSGFVRTVGSDAGAEGIDP